MYFSVVLAFFVVFLSVFQGAECLGSRTCDLGWLQDPHSSNCYRFFPASLAWKDARNSCVGQGALLAVIPSIKTNEFITTNVSRGFRSWIGLHNQNTSTQAWEWSVVSRAASFKNWAAGEPNNQFWPFRSEECAEIEDASGKWNDETCNSLRSYVCQKTIGCDASQLSGYTLPANATSSIVPVGSSVTVDTKCRVGYRPENATTSTTCQADGTWSFDNVKCTEIFCRDPSNSRLHNGKFYVDPPSSPYAVGSKIRYQCDIGYMLRGNAVSDCRDMDSRLPIGVWDQPPICLKSPECEPGWVAHNNYCYRYVSELMTWHDADTRCQTLGGDWSRLVAINSRSENALLQQLSNKTTNIWIGLHDVPSEGVWEWVDSSAVSYKNFNDGEPNNGLYVWEQEDCVEMDLSTGRWNDEGCDSFREFICEKFVAN